MKLKKILLLSALCIEISTKTDVTEHTVIDHKSSDVSSYMAQISGGQTEKSQILEYITQNGNYLDIGSGADTIAHIIGKTKDKKYTITLADLEQQVLVDALAKHPSLIDNMQTKMPHLALEQINATNMAKIESNSLDGLSASALLHEVFSYCPSRGSIDQFLGEVCRTLKEDGMFIYRDPASLDDAKQFSSLELKTKNVRQFFNIWATKFFDRDFSNVFNFKGECGKPTKHHPEKILVDYTKKENGRSFVEHIFLDEFLKCESETIDFDKPIVIIAPRLFISELLRHYVLFLQNNKDANLIDSLTTQGISMELKKESATQAMQKLFCKGIKPNLVHVDNNTITFDCKMITLLWKSKRIEKTIEPHNQYENILNWLNREGEEHYFYLDLDSLITYVARFSTSELRTVKCKDLMLAPIDTNGIRFYDRPTYKKWLYQSVCLRDLTGHEQPIITKKNVIHFKMVPVADGLKTLSAIAQQHKFEKLAAYVQSASTKADGE